MNKRISNNKAKVLQMTLLAMAVLSTSEKILINLEKKIIFILSVKTGLVILV